MWWCGSSSPAWSAPGPDEALRFHHDPVPSLQLSGQHVGGQCARHGDQFRLPAFVGAWGGDAGRLGRFAAHLGLEPGNEDLGLLTSEAAAGLALGEPERMASVPEVCVPGATIRDSRWRTCAAGAGGPEG